jgi:DNA mismatch repair ATPase MutS
MGGKTVALQSLLFFQIVAQSGLYVPARAFSSQVFDAIEYVGEGAGGESRGLSSFGHEIHFLSKILRMSMTKSCLVAFDEFAHTTGSEEAEALLAAVIHHFLGMERCAILFATHFRGIARHKNVHWLKMAGLDIEAARIWFSADASGIADPSGAAKVLESSPSLEERIRRINRLMRYEILEDKGENGDREDRSDALEIASLLGLDETIVEEAVLNLSVSRLKYREKHPE